MKDSKNLVIGMLCAVVCVMAVAYAAFATTLTINGTSTIASEWCVRIKEATCPTKAPVSGGATNSVTAEASVASNALDATITMGFTQPGDTATCQVVYENCGTVDVLLTHTITGADGTDAIDFVVTGATNNGTTELSANAGKNATHNITVQGTYKSTITEDPAAAAKTAKLSITSVATQKIK